MDYERYYYLKSIKDPIESINALLLLDDDDLHLYGIIDEWEREFKNMRSDLIEEYKCG